MLAKEITRGIKKPNEGYNVVIKLDMAMAYDRVFWPLTILVIWKIGFSEIVIDMVWRIVSNNWYFAIVNGTRHVSLSRIGVLKKAILSLRPYLF